MSLDPRYPCIDDLERAALRRIPWFASEYLRGGIGREVGLARNRAALDAVLLDACYLPEALTNDPDMSAALFGKRYALPFGISPIGFSGLMWPRAAEILGKAAAEASIPMGLSHFATTHMREFRRIAGDCGWFQIYPPWDPEIRASMLDEIAETGFETLVVTVDIPSLTRRDREKRAGLSVPPRLTARALWEIATHPRWALAAAAAGVPEFENFKRFLPPGIRLADKGTFLTDMVEGQVTRPMLREMRDRWKGNLVVKGIMTEADARAALDCGADAIWASNHGARQLDAAPAPIEVLPAIRAAIGRDVPLLVDSGPRTGLDIARMLASGADFVFLGRAFIFAVAALGARGGDHAVHILRDELRSAMAQIGARSVSELAGFLRK